MIDYKNVDLDGLQSVYDASIGVTLDMKRWRCGTAACLIGNFCINHPADTLQLKPCSSLYSTCYFPTIISPEAHDNSLADVEAISYRFSLPEYLTQFLFTSHHRSLLRTRTAPVANVLPSDKARQRLQNTIRYLRRKKALLEEHEWMMSLSKQERRLTSCYDGVYTANTVGAT